MISKSVLVIDNGLFQPLAHQLSKHFDKVYYYREWHESFPTPTSLAIGTGYDDIERVDSILAMIPQVDLFVFPDLYWSEEVEYLRTIGKQVFGAGMGESMELNRKMFYEWMEEHGLNLLHHEYVTGIKALREHLQEVEDKYVKVSYVRGLMETWKHIDYRLSKPKVDEIEHLLGALSEEQEFIIEDKLDAKREVGSDLITVDGQFPKTVQYAIEGKDKTSLAEMRPYASLPKEVRDINNELSEWFNETGYRGFASTEIRVAKDNKAYLIDPTARHASPCGETFNLLCENLGEVIDAASQEIMIDPKPKKRYAAQAIILSDIASTTSVPIYIDPKIREYVALYHSGKRASDGQECVFITDSEMKEIGSVMGVGDTIQEAIKHCQENAHGIECYGLTIYTDMLEEAIPALKAA